MLCRSLDWMVSYPREHHSSIWAMQRSPGFGHLPPARWVVPLVFYQYPVIFRGGNLQLYKSVMFHLCLMFISMTRRHYNKASLSWLSDLHYQAKYLPELYNFRANNLSPVTEKKVEIYHSVLRRHILRYLRYFNKYIRYNKIQETARVMNAISYKSEFVDGYVKSYHRDYILRKIRVSLQVYTYKIKCST